MQITHAPATTIRTHVPGFPRIGADRELVHALARHAQGSLTDAALHQVGRVLRARHWALQRDAGLDYVSVGDFAWCDQVANHLQLLGCTPPRFDHSLAPLSLHLALAHGPGALESQRWFGTAYHYLVPEWSPETTFSLACEQLFDDVAEAHALGHPVKAVLLGPLTLLWLGRNTTPFDRLALLERLLPVYCAVLDRLKAQGVAWVQIDEPILGLDLPIPWRSAYDAVYWQLNQVGVPLLLATYFSPLEENLSLACRLPVAGLHVDGVRAAHELASVADWLPVHKVLSVGIVDGRNVWRTDIGAALAVLAPLLDKRRQHLWLSSSCSLLHVPLSLAGEEALDHGLRGRLAFAVEKLDELAALKSALMSAPQAPQVPVHAGPPVHAGDTGTGPGGAVHTRNGWVQAHGAHCVKPPLLDGDAGRDRPHLLAWTSHVARGRRDPVPAPAAGASGAAVRVTVFD